MLIFILCIEFLASMHTTVTHTTQMVKQTAVSILLIYCTVLCKYCKGTQESVRTLRNLIFKLCLYFPSVVLQQCTAGLIKPPWGKSFKSVMKGSEVK